MAISRFLSKDTLTITRQSSSRTLQPDGKYLETSAPIEFDASGSVHPFRGSQVKQLPEGYVKSAAKWFYTKTQLRSSEQYTKLTADTTIINTFVWEVFDEEDWESVSADTTHHKYLLIRRDINAQP